MPESPLSKKQKVRSPVVTPEHADHTQITNEAVIEQKSINDEEDEDEIDDIIPSHISYSKSRTPRKLVIDSGDSRFALSQPIPSHSNSSFMVPSLQPPLSQNISASGRHKAYSQSPPRSPGRSQTRSPTRKLELIQLSPIKNSRVELQKLYKEHNSKTRKKERLFIDQLVLHNFKSYAGTQVVGPFNTSFSAVVGPNGSGKSNVIDSMLFVFGFRANKMRQERLSDLIHNSEAFPDLTSCSVEVHFQYVIDLVDGTSKVDTDRGSLVVTRKAFKNNSSKYYINGKESKYTEVTKLLKEEGIDLEHKRFLILQGEVENIAQMKPKAEKENDDGLLEYLEDIIGTAKYKPLIEQDMVEVDALNDICIEKENRFDIVDREKNSLESAKDSALEFLEKEKQLTLLRSSKIQYKLNQSNQKMKNTLEKVSNLNESLEKENKKFIEHQKEMGELTTQRDLFSKELKQLDINETELSKNKRKLKTEEVSMEEMLRSLTQKKNKAEKVLTKTEHSISQNESDLKNLEEEKNEYTSSNQDLNQQLEVEKVKLDEIKFSLKDKTQHISDEITAHEKDLEPWNVQIRDKKLEIQLTESEISVLKETQIKLEQEIKDTKIDIDNKKDEITSTKSRIEDLSRNQKSLSSETQTGEIECNSAKLKMKEMQDVLSTQRQRAMEARSTLSNAENKNKVLAALTRLEKSGRISGFHGRLGDLGIISEKFDVAISTACPRLDDIVVDTVECGQQCIEYLRKNKLGYAKFILLDKLRKFNVSAIQTPDGVPRLFDLVKPRNNKLIPAFYSVLKDTLVAHDLKQANKVAYGKRRFRVVTLDGKLIDISGTMSGGGNYVSRGMMKVGDSNVASFTSYTPEEVRKMEIELEERERNFKVANETFHEMQQELKRLKDQVPEIEVEISKVLMDVDSLKNEISLKETILKQKEASYSEAINEKEDLTNAETKLDSFNEEIKILEEQTKSRHERIKELKDKIMKLGGIDLQVQNSKVSSLSERIDITHSKLKKFKSSLKKKENELKKDQINLKNAQEDTKSCTEESTKVEEKLESTRKELIEYEHSLNKLLDNKDDMNDKIQQFKEKISELENDLNEFKSFELEIKNKSDKLNGLVNCIKQEIKESNSELYKLKIRDVTRTLQLLDEGKIDEIQSEVEQKTRNDNEIEELSNVAAANSDSMDLDDGSEILNDISNTVNDSEQEQALQNDPLDEEMDVDEKAAEISLGIPKISDTRLNAIDLDDLENEIKSLEDYINTTGANINDLEEYARRLIEYKTRKHDLNTAVEKRDEVRKQLEGLKKTRYDEFMEGFSIISMTLKEMYQMITMGGNAELELVDSLDPFSEGVTFSVMPPKKSWRNISNLSGGEKTLSSLALVFALHKYRPTPLYVMDEIDAALDFRNVSIVANYIKEQTKNAQFIVISLRNNMFELAQQLVGVYKRDNRTSSVTLKNEDILN